MSEARAGALWMVGREWVASERESVCVLCVGDTDAKAVRSCRDLTSGRRNAKAKPTLDEVGRRGEGTKH